MASAFVFRITAWFRARSRRTLTAALTAANVANDVTAEVVAVWRNAATLLNANRQHLTEIAGVDEQLATTIQQVAVTMAADRTVDRYNHHIAAAAVTLRRSLRWTTDAEMQRCDVYVRQIVCDRYAAVLAHHRRPHASQEVAELRHQVAGLAGPAILEAFDAAVDAVR